MARWTRIIMRKRRKVTPEPRPAAGDGVLEPQAFREAADRALSGGQSRGVVLVILRADDLGLDGGADALLVAAENRIARAIRPGDLLGRLDRGRLAVLAGSDEGPDGAARIAERVADRLAEPFHIAGREVEVGLRIGVAAKGDGADGLIQKAEQSLATVRH